MTVVRRESRTDDNGYYTIASLPLTGKYKMTFTKAGFAPEEKSEIELRAGETATLNATLDPQAGQSFITIFGTTEGVRSDSPQTGTRFDLKKIDETPIFGRKLTNLPLLNSAVKPARSQGDLFLNNTLFVINGGGRRQPTFNIDGSSANDSWGRQTIFTNIPFSA